MSKEKVPGFPPEGTWELQGQRLDGPDVSDEYVRQACIEIARSCIGMRPDDPGLYDALYPWDPEWARKSMAKSQSKCALFALAVLRACGFALPTDGMALSWKYGSNPPPVGIKPPPDPMTQLVSLEKFRKWQHLPEEGCIMVIGRAKEPTSTHALVVLGYEDMGHTVVSADGGMGAIKEARRSVMQQGNTLCLYDKVMGLRPVIGTLDPAEMRGAVIRDYCLPMI